MLLQTLVLFYVVVSTGRNPGREGKDAAFHHHHPPIVAQNDAAVARDLHLGSCTGFTHDNLINFENCQGGIHSQTQRI